MPSAGSPLWQDRANGFFSSSGAKLKEAGQSAGSFMGEVAKDAKGNVTDVAGRVGSAVKSRWQLLREPATRHVLQEQLITAAATTGMFLRKGYSDTKDKVTVGKTKLEEVAKKTAQKSKTILTDIERRQKGVASTDVFGVPIEVSVQRQLSSRSVPNILVKCADYLILSGLNSINLFKAEGDKKIIQQLVSMYNQDLDASLPEGVNPVDVAALVKCYLASLPEPLTTFEHYNEIKIARSSIHAMKNVLKKLPTVNYMTLEFVTAILLRVSQKSFLNKMDARSLAMETAPVIMWRKEQKPESYQQYWRNASGTPKNSMDQNSTYTAWDMLAEEGEGTDASSAIPLDDGAPVDFGAIEVVQCLIEQHNTIFTDAHETVWRDYLRSTDLFDRDYSLEISMATIILTVVLVFFVAFFSSAVGDEFSGEFPLVVSTWPFKEAVRTAWRAVDGGLSAVDAVVEGCSTCEELRCDGTVGPGGSPDENGETTIDALIMNGVTMEVGAVAAMRYVKDGIRAAKLVMQHTQHTLLAGEQASVFAISMGLSGPTNLSSPESIQKWTKWKEIDCQPNFRKNIVPTNGCGPYHPKSTMNINEGECSKIDLMSPVEPRSALIGPGNHDTISMAVIDKMGHVAVGTSTNGATFKIPGRVGDGPIVGSSAYADSEIGACGATGDGDIMMRFLPCYQAVESMRLGMEPKDAAKDAIKRIARKFPNFVGAVFAVNKKGVHAGACHGWIFQYSVMSPQMKDVQVFTVLPSS
ncbi:small G protein family protein / RhoGAP family protein [Euphorbia peplus]|nr:small G protein family protein / RhoGAP family protein [Euphorbia peplus]